jgi:amylosucrase
VFWGVRHILSRRRVTPALHAGVPLRILATDIAGLFAFVREAPTGPVLCLFNFTEGWLHCPEDLARGLGVQAMHDDLSDHPVETYHGNIALPPYARVWLR